MIWLLYSILPAVAGMSTQTSDLKTQRDLQRDIQRDSPDADRFTGFTGDCVSFGKGFM